MQQLLLVGAGGFIGAISRFLLSSFVQQMAKSYWLPFGTIAVNIVGCYLIGLLNGIDHIKQIFNPEIRLLVFVGMLGGFTTFATFGYETFELLKSNYTVSGLLNILVQVTFGLAAVWLGSITSKLLF